VIGALAMIFLPGLLEGRRQLTLARSDLRTAREAILEQRQGEALDALGSAARRLARAGRRARSFPARLLKPVPVLGSPTRALDDAARAGAGAVAAGRAVARASSSFPTAGPSALAGQDLSPFHDATARAADELDQAERDLAAARGALVGPAGAFLPPVSGPARAMLDEVDRGRRQVDGVRRGLGLLADLSGPGADVRLLLLSQDSLELRPTGGYIGSFGVLRFSHGTVSLERYEATEALPAPQPPMTPPPELAPVLPRWWGLSNVNWWPDFPTTARTAREMFKRQGGQEVDGVVALTEQAIARLIGVLGPLQVPGYGEPVVEEGFDRRLVYEVELKRPLDEPRKRFLIELAKVVFDRLFKLPADKLPAVTRAVDRSVGAGDVQVWFADPGRQRRLEGTRWTGALPSVERDFLQLVDVNLSASKANLALTKEVTYRVTRQQDGRLAAHLEITVRNEGAKSPINPLYNSFLRVYVPREAELLDAPEDQYDDGPAPDGPYRVFSQFMTVPPRSATSAAFSYRLPDRAAPGGDYRLTWVRQAGTPNDSFVALLGGRSVEADPADRVTRVGADLDGNPLVAFLRSRWIVRKLMP